MDPINNAATAKKRYRMFISLAKIDPIKRMRSPNPIRIKKVPSRGNK
jgi:hypothetical protein